jgi:hypothetical protein
MKANSRKFLKSSVIIAAGLMTDSLFFIVAKKWGNRINTMTYTGPEREFTPEESKRNLY